ncbi:hypothetical protein A1O7_06875 [Cladophialophora yegresii CBS 114405]|uniref:DUF7729 domain-containing protein n=1 Tax=Cladophialophora yegresii CBS 114405 TaxID=1182544 RepID=W9VWD3_9EURO|nr:uncharacterized protein A1O7_06875 [Cladophialophora yegresii CBS 114405]EXJ56531.1 hypothetical protein A1O7_06875 [Cladophialophora yegresii CBS 114405]
MEIEPQIYESPFFQELAVTGEIHIAQGQPPARHDIYHDLVKRQVTDSNGDSDSDSDNEGGSVVPTTLAEPTTIATSTPTSISSVPTSPEPTTTSPSPSITTETKTSDATPGVSTSTSPSVTVITTPLPTPFDTSLGSNFTTPSCPQFFSTFLSNTTFQSCVPVSLLLQNSNSFFRALRSSTLLTQTLEAACSAPLAICSPLMATLAAQLLDHANCGDDYSQQNPLVVQAYAGLVAYEPVYRATCLKDGSQGGEGNADESTTTSSTSSSNLKQPYCFVEATTNANNSADFYPYYTAIGLSMPLTARPSCSECLKETMDIFASYAENAAQPLAKTYLTCAAQVDKSCGSGFVSTDVKVGSVESPNAAAGMGAFSPSVLSLVVFVGLIALVVGVL